MDRRAAAAIPCPSTTYHRLASQCNGSISILLHVWHHDTPDRLALIWWTDHGTVLSPLTQRQNAGADRSLPRSEGALELGLNIAASNHVVGPRIFNSTYTIDHNVVRHERLLSANA